MDRRIVEDLYRRVAPPVYNDLMRPVAVGAVNAMAFTGLAVAAAAKATIEYGIVKPLFYGFVKLPTRHVIEVYNRQASRPVEPDAWYYPHLDHFNWGDRTRTRANGNSDRPNWMNWFWNPEAARYWGLWWEGSAAAPGGGRAGNFRIAEWRLRLRHLPTWGEEAGSDKFNPDTMYEPKQAHSARWYQEAGNWISQQIVQKVEAILEYALTPRLDAARTNFIQADGTNPIPVTRNENGVIVNAPIAAAYYRHPQLWKALTGRDVPRKVKAIKHIIDNVTTHWKEQHSRLYESTKMHVAYKNLFSKLRRKVAYINLYQKLAELSKRLGYFDYSIDNAFLGFLLRSLV